VSSTRYALCTLRSVDGPRAAIEVNGKIWPLDRVAPEMKLGDRGLMGLIADWAMSRERLGELACKLGGGDYPEGRAVAEAEFLTPLQYPAKVICAGTNYFDHVEAFGYPNFSKEANIPALFMKPPTTSLVGPGSTVKFPDGCKELDWEVELCAVMGSRASKLEKTGAMDVVAGYMIAIDMSARDLQRNPKHFAKMDLFLGKAFDTACPAGPFFVPAEFVGDPQDLTLTLRRNSTVEQQSNTSKMIWDIADLLVTVTNYVTLEPGDLLLTGTPAGTGIEKGTYARIGDVLEAEIQNLGSLRVEIC
jgi:2-keto-4-pentenoate hydratase/2-oxohepta-3-ene-1,7-dioic acid hydratase in catechol pathway